MENKICMSEIQTIVDLLKENNKKLEEMNKSFLSLHHDLTTFKGEVSTALTDTNGKLKGNHELLSVKIDQLSTDLKRIDKVLGDQIQINHDEILRNKNTISSLYDLDREATKRDDDAHAQMNKDIDGKLKEIGDTSNESKIKINIIWGVLSVIATALVYSIIK